MFKSALIETVKTFSKQEIKDFGAFVQSPFFNTNQSVIKLYEQVRKLYPDFDEKDLEKQILFKKAFGEIKYNDSFMRMTIFRFQELAKEFLVHRNLQNNNLLKETLLLDELNIRELNNLMLKSINDLDTKIEKQKVKEADTYFAKYKLEYFKNEAKALDTKMITYKDILDKNLMHEQKNLNIFFFLSSLKFFQYFLNQKNFVVKTEGYPEFMNNILEYLKHNNEYLNIPALKIYYYMVLMLVTNDDKYFFELEKLLYEDEDDISYFEKFNLIATLRNYAQRKYNEGNKDFKTSLIGIVKFSINKNILSPSPEGKFISEMRFMNIVWTGVHTNELIWLEEFIKKFINRIDPDKRQYVSAYNLAVLEFAKGNYSEALEKLGKSGSIKNVLYKAAIKQLTLMVYYELKWFIPAYDLLEAYRHFIKTNKLLPETYITRGNMFINYYNRLLNINDNVEKNTDFKLSKLISEIKLTSQDWLLKKAQELETKRL
ncbi:MAG: hypothetical protein ABIY50_13350 [Ignavibacteria bacterium]